MRKHIILCVVLALIMSVRAFAEETLFNYTPVKFFEEAEPKKEQVEKLVFPEEKKTSEIVEDEWMEPVVGPGGRITYYVPPEEVKNFLNNPNDETGSAYLQWNLNRINKLSKAQTILRKLAEKLGIRTSKEQYAINSTADDKAEKSQTRHNFNKTYIAFFLLKNCSYCEEQKIVINKFIKNHPSVNVEIFLKGYNKNEIKNFSAGQKADSGVSDVFGVKSWPSTLIVNKYGGKFLISGLIRKETIETLLEKKNIKLEGGDEN